MYQQKLFQWELARCMKSKEIVLMAFGESKADAIKGMIEGPVTNHLPASVLLPKPRQCRCDTSMKSSSRIVIYKERLGQKRLTPRNKKDSRNCFSNFCEFQLISEGVASASAVNMFRA